MFFKLIDRYGVTIDVTKDTCPEGYLETTEEEYNKFIKMREESVFISYYEDTL